MSTKGLIGRTSAACRRRVIHAGDTVGVTSTTAAAYRGQRSDSSSDTVRRSDSPMETGASGPRTPGFGDAGVYGSSYAVAISRARPATLRQSGRLAVTSKSITPSPPSRRSTEATSKPRSASFSAISSGDAVTSTKSRAQEINKRTVAVSFQLSAISWLSWCALKAES